MKPGLATYGFAGVVLAIVAILVVPLPPPLLDALLACNVIGSGIVLLVSITVADPLEFAAFAPTLLIATLFRLSLDVSATRLILTQGDVEGGVGDLIPAFGRLVVHGNLVVGLVVFVILVTIQFLVIASGAQRVAEVAARFTLDAMPGKQMAIDAELHAGHLDAETARRKRAAVQREADFYGAMDGAGKFIKGDAIAALVIVALNLVGGVVVGVAYHAMSPLDALDTFAILSIGNALVTTLPAFLLSTAMGLMVTRVTATGSLGADLVSQLFARPEVTRAAGAFSLALALVPALPRPIFLAIGVALFVVAARSRSAGARRLDVERAVREQARRTAIRRPEMALGLVGVDAISIDVGAGLGALLLPPLSEALLDRVGEVRRALAAEIGIVLPGVRLRDDLARDATTYALRVRDVVAGAGVLRLDRVLAVASVEVLRTLGGEAVAEPVYGLPGRWIDASGRDVAVAAGALVFDPISIVGSHLAEIARTHAARLLGRQELHTLVEHLRAGAPSLVKELGTDMLPLATVQRVFENLLEERAWPRDVHLTLDALIEAAQTSRDPREMTESVRRAIVPGLLRRRDLATFEPLLFDPGLERELVAWLGDGTLAPQPQTAVALRESVARYAAARARDRAAIVCTAPLRAGLSQLLRRFGLAIDVFAFGELPPEHELRPALVVDGQALTAAAARHAGQRPVTVSARSISS